MSAVDQQLSVNIDLSINSDISFVINLKSVITIYIRQIYLARFTLMYLGSLIYNPTASTFIPLLLYKWKDI